MGTTAVVAFVRLPTGSYLSFYPQQQQQQQKVKEKAQFVKIELKVTGLKVEFEIGIEIQLEIQLEIELEIEIEKGTHDGSAFLDLQSPRATTTSIKKWTEQCYHDNSPEWRVD